MKKLLLIVFSFLFLNISAQSKITVFSAGNNLPITGATVSCNNKFLGTTNAQGFLQFRTNCKKVNVKAPGFFEDEAVVDKVMEVVLSRSDPKTQSIQGVIIDDKSDPLALEILRKVNDNYKINSPQSLDSYAFKSYEKISLDIDEDSIKHYDQFINHRLDSLKTVPIKEQSKDKKKDSIESVNVQKLMTSSKLFLWERASQYLFSQKYGEKINILDNRVSGLKQPIYEMISLRSNRNQIPREIREENRTLYRYFLTDSIDIDGRKNYVIRFRQVDYKQAAKKRRFNGYIYVDSETYGLKKIESNSKKKSEGSITSIWTRIDNKWFLRKENLKMKMGSTAFNTEKSDQSKDKDDLKKQKYGNYVFITADYFDFKTPIEVNKKDFSGYTIDVKNTDGSTLDQFRTDSLTTREKMTYDKIDSVGKKYKLDQKLNVFTGLIKGDLRVGNVDFDGIRFIQYNDYEGLRLGAAAKLNEKFNKYISPDAYFAYGIKDKAWKYGAGITIKTTVEKVSFFRAEYYNDVSAAGRFNEILWNFKKRIMNSGIDMYNNRFYKLEGFKLSYQNDLTNALTVNIFTKRDNEEAKFDYNFMNLGNKFQNVATQITLKYSPKSKNIMTPSGKFTYEENYPEFFANYEQGLKILGGELTYGRFDVLGQHSFKTKIGVTGFRVYAGLLTGSAPIWHHFGMNGLGSNKGELNFNLTSYLGFATMEGGKYYNDKFVGFYFTHRIPWYFKTFGKNVSSFDAVLRGVTGDLKNTQEHQFDFQKLDHLYLLLN